MYFKPNLNTNLLYKWVCYLVHWSFPLESVKDEANLICAAEGKRKLRFLSENPIWNLVEKVGGAAADICLKIQFWCSSSIHQKVQNGQLHIGKISENLCNLDLSFLSKNQKEYLNTGRVPIGNYVNTLRDCETSISNLYHGSFPYKARINSTDWTGKTSKVNLPCTRDLHIRWILSFSRVDNLS